MAWAGGLAALLLTVPAMADAPFGDLGDGGAVDVAIGEFTDLLVDVLVWFEFGDPITIALIFVAAQMAGGVLLFAALLMVQRIGSGRASFWSLPLAIPTIAAAGSLGFLRDLMAIATSAIGLLCPSPTNCGASGGVFAKHDSYAYFAAGLLVPAAVTFLMRRRASGRAGISS